MTKSFPDYLKLHVEESSLLRTPTADTQGLGAVLRAFEATTGWQLKYVAAEQSEPRSAWTMPIGVTSGEDGKFVLVQDESSSHSAPLSLERIQPLAQAIGDLVSELHRTQSTVWQREAELAAGIPVTLRPDEQGQLAGRLESVLRGGAEAVGCQAAALYLLDDATSHLKLRAAWSLPKSRYLDAPRPLRGAVADLEALVGHAVALENTALLPHWKAPEDFPAALCVPVASSSTPLGTLWFFAQQVREFSPEQTHLAEIVAGRLVSDLEREVLIREGLRHRQTDQARQLLAQWQDEQRPNVPPLVDGWQIAGRLSGEDSLGGQLFDWSVLPDGRIAVAVGQADGMHLEASLTATTLHIALKSHATYPHDPRQMLDRLNEALWTYSTGNRFASLFYALIDPDIGEMEYASAGDTHALIVSPQGCETVGECGMLLGSDPDHRFVVSRRRIEEGQSLVLFTRGYLMPVAADVLETDAGLAAAAASALARPTAEELINAVADALTAPTHPERALLAVRRIF
ncbi:MAG: PP2C family protein-serine/threonine phosphatase [Pirellulaceae bacterium]